MCFPNGYPWRDVVETVLRFYQQDLHVVVALTGDGWTRESMQNVASDKQPPARMIGAAYLLQALHKTRFEHDRADSVSQPEN